MQLGLKASFVTSIELNAQSLTGPSSLAIMKFLPGVWADDDSSPALNVAEFRP